METVLYGKDFVGCSSPITPVREGLLKVVFRHWQQSVKSFCRRLELVPKQAHVRSNLVVKVEELIERIRLPSMLLIGLKEPFELSIGLWAADFAERMFDVVLVKIPFELVVETRTINLPGVDKFATGIGDDL